MPFPELTLQELRDLKQSCRCLFPEIRFSEIDNNFLRSLNTNLLRSAYKKRIFNCHPDRLGAVSDTMIKLKTKECQQINEAYQTLKHFVQARNEWIYTVLTSYNYQTAPSPAQGTGRHSHHARADIFEWFKQHIHLFTGSFRGGFREVPRESARSM